jgi:hypothetical protein
MENLNIIRVHIHHFLWQGWININFDTIVKMWMGKICVYLMNFLHSCTNYRFDFCELWWKICCFPFLFICGYNNGNMTENEQPICYGFWFFFYFLLSTKDEYFYSKMCVVWKNIMYNGFCMLSSKNNIVRRNYAKTFYN